MFTQYFKEKAQKNLSEFRLLNMIFNVYHLFLNFYFQTLMSAATTVTIVRQTLSVSTYEDPLTVSVKEVIGKVMEAVLVGLS